MSKPVITIEAIVNKPIGIVWECWTKPEHITKWCFASDDWHAPSSTSDFKVGGKISTRMEAKDGSFGFDFWGIYNDIKTNEKVGVVLGDDRKWDTYFSVVDGSVKVVEEFEAESQNPIEMQQAGWQMILNNFKKYVESL
ncbi:MAG TPA: SRPBCC domain-containing protein [Bacteroidia bacterium]|nr:SRPBCC domain-containing protein [Bacteroidia bacterium]